jgi:rRNA maturation protein Nop10
MKAVYHYQDVCGVCGDEKRLRVPADGNGTEETWVRCSECGRITRVTKGPMDEGPEWGER